MQLLDARRNVPVIPLTEAPCTMHAGVSTLRVWPNTTQCTTHNRTAHYTWWCALHMAVRTTHGGAHYTWWCALHMVVHQTTMLLRSVGKVTAHNAPSLACRAMSTRAASVTLPPPTGESTVLAVRASTHRDRKRTPARPHADALVSDQAHGLRAVLGRCVLHQVAHVDDARVLESRGCREACPRDLLLAHDLQVAGRDLHQRCHAAGKCEQLRSDGSATDGRHIGSDDVHTTFDEAQDLWATGHTSASTGETHEPSTPKHCELARSGVY